MLKKTSRDTEINMLAISRTQMYVNSEHFIIFLLGNRIPTQNNFMFVSFDFFTVVVGEMVYQRGTKIDVRFKFTECHWFRWRWKHDRLL